MTSRERILATLRGDEVDRFPVWLKIANGTWRGYQPKEIRSLPDIELLRAAGCDLLLGAGLASICESPQVEKKVSRDNGDRTTTYTTREGSLSGIEGFSNDSWHPVQYPVETREQLENLRRIFVDRSFRVNDKDATEHSETQQEMVKLDAVSMTGIGPSPLMDLIEHWCGPVAAIYLMTDEPDLFGDTLQTMHECRMRELKALLPRVKSDTFWLTENTSTTLLSPAMFEKYCMPHLRDYGNLILEYGIIPIHHMCGTLNALLELIDQLPAIANEAYTTRPLGDVSLAEGRARMPSKVLIGGTNATLWLEEPEVIIETVALDLAACPNRRGIFLTSAGVLPPLVSLEKARTVAEQLKGLQL